MQLFGAYSLVALSVFPTRQISALPAGSNEPWPFNHPVLDPPPESLSDEYEGDVAYTPVFPNGYTEGYSQDDGPEPGTWTIGSSTPNEQASSSVPNADHAWISQYAQELHDSYNQLVQQMPQLQVGDDVMINEEGNTIRELDMRRIFYEIAEDMGSKMSRSALCNRLQDYGSPDLLRAIVSGDMRSKRRAVRTILLQRIPQKSRYGPKTTARLPSPIYEGHTKEQILHRMYRVMDVEPMEDVEHLWYDRICHQPEREVFVKLYSNNPRDQIAAIRELVDLIPYHALWVREKKKTGRPAFS